MTADPHPPLEASRGNPAPPALSSRAGTAEERMACDVCDALQHVHDVRPGERLKCLRCGNVLLIHEGHAADTVMAGALAMVILLVSSVFLPFLQISASGLRSSASILDTALAFSTGVTAPLTLAVFMLIVVLPVARATLLLYTLLPLRLALPAFPLAKRAFRLASELRPWCMAEVFIIGVAVALVKIGAMATVSFGPAFWELTLILVIVIAESGNSGDKTLWRMLEKRIPS